MAQAFYLYDFYASAAILENLFCIFSRGLHSSFTIKFPEKIAFALVHLYYEDIWDIVVYFDIILGDKNMQKDALGESKNVTNHTYFLQT